METAKRKQSSKSKQHSDRKLTKNDLRLIRRVMEAYAVQQMEMHEEGVYDKHARAFNHAARISRYKLARV